MSTRYDITGIQGSDLHITLTGLNESSTAINLSGYNVRGKVRFQYGSTGTLLDLAPTVQSGAAGVSFVSGLIDIFVSGNQLTGVPVTRAKYDVEVYNDSNVTGLFNGKFSILPEITY